MFNIRHFILSCLLLFVAVSCRKSGVDIDSLPVVETLTHEASLLRLTDHGDGIMSAVVSNPWNSEAAPAIYLLVDKSVEEDNIPNITDAEVIRVPIESALVYSSVHATPFEELERGDIITGVADADFYHSPYIRQRLASGRIVNVGSSMSPSLERIVDLSPDVALASPMQNAPHSVLESSGVTIVSMADYMEPTPLGRAEWIKLLGVLTGRLPQATAIYQQVKNDYLAIKSQNANAESRPKVLTELPYSGVWYQPGGHSYMSALIRDAGGRPVLDTDKSAGSVQLDIALAVDRGSDADVWLIKTTHPLTDSELRAASPLVSDIKAYKVGNVWYADTERTDLYDDLAFHPERILADMTAIFHPTDSTGLRYYKKL